IDRTIPYPAGPLESSDAEIDLADTDGAVRGWFDTITPLRRLAEFKLVQEGGSESAAAPFYTGEIKGAIFQSGKTRVQIRDIMSAWLDDQIPALGTKDNWPNQPLDQPSFFWPIIFGKHQSPFPDSPSIPQGQINCPLADN